MTRADLAAEATRLRGRGLSVDEIGERMGISRSYASSLINDPDRSKEMARRNRYRKPCPECGRLMDGSGGYKSASRACLHCAPRLNRKWYPETVVQAIQAFANRYGRPPAATDWNTTLAVKYGRPSPTGQGYPSAWCVQQIFGSWNAAIEAAGFEPLAPGKKRRAA